jgi:hypothetical protein
MFEGFNGTFIVCATMIVLVALSLGA